MSVMIAMFIVTFAIIAGSKTVLNYLEVTNRVRGKDLLSQVEDSVRELIENKIGDYLEEKHAYIEAAGNAQVDYASGQYSTMPSCDSILDIQDISWGQPTSYFSVSLVKDINIGTLSFAGEPNFYTQALNRCAESNQKWGMSSTDDRFYFCLRIDPVGALPANRSVLEKGPALVEVSYTLWNSQTGLPNQCRHFFESHTRSGAILYRMYWRTTGTQGGTNVMQSTTSGMISKTHG